MTLMGGRKIIARKATAPTRKANRAVILRPFFFMKMPMTVAKSTEQRLTMLEHIPGTVESMSPSLTMMLTL